MMMIIATMQIIFNVIFHQPLKITFRKSLGSSKRIHSALLKIQKVQVPPFC